MTSLILVRHGETEWNRAGRIQGHSDSALTSKGVAQAEAMGVRLHEGRSSEVIDHVFSSDLQRATQTASIITALTGHQVSFDERLRERAFGIAEGKTYAEIDRDHPEMFSRIRKTDPDFAAPGGESRHQFQARIVGVLTSIVTANRNKRVLVITHGGALASVYRWLNGLPASSPHHIDIPNVAYNRINVAERAWQIEVWGDTSHLDATTDNDRS